jgi:hypothetical protein
MQLIAEERRIVGDDAPLPCNARGIETRSAE